MSSVQINARPQVTATVPTSEATSTILNQEEADKAVSATVSVLVSDAMRGNEGESPSVTVSVTISQSVPNTMGEVTTRPTQAASANRMSAEDAAGVLAAHMSQTQKGTLDVNALYKLAQDPATPPRVAEAANYFLKNPDDFQKVETHDVAGTDGLSGIGNFQSAGKGEIGGLAQAGDQMTGADAAGTLSAHLRSNNLGKLDTNDLYKLAQNPDTSPRVAEAANYFLRNPQAYAKLETNDVAGVDAISGVGNFDNGALGKVDGLAGANPQQTQGVQNNLGHVQGVQNNLGQHGGPNNNLLGNSGSRIDNLINSALNNSGAMPNRNVLGNTGSRIDNLIANTLALLDGSRPSSGASTYQPMPRMTASDAAGSLAAHMRDNNMASLNPSTMYKLATDPSISPRVAEAAKFFIDNPDQYRKLETNDVMGADGISGIRNFEKAAVGKIDGLA